MTWREFIGPWLNGLAVATIGIRYFGMPHPEDKGDPWTLFLFVFFLIMGIWDMFFYKLRRQRHHDHDFVNLIGGPACRKCGWAP